MNHKKLMRKKLERIELLNKVSDAMDDALVIYRTYRRRTKIKKLPKGKSL